jgi:hypothetical protein
MILGVSSLVKHPERPPAVLNKFADIFCMLIKLVKKNAEERIDEDEVDQKENAKIINFDDDED